MIGKRINDRYQLVDKIGGGGMANVYKAHDAILNRTVAVKVLRPQFSEDDEFIRRFRREAHAATSLSHPNVVNIFDVGEEDNLYYIVMEYVEGKTLKELIQERGVISTQETVNIMQQILSAISHAHANHIVHRDIKPHNILISDKGEAKVTDFGIARAMTSATITHTNSVMGSVHYLSPEQARGGLVNEKSDIYSLGIVLYEMVTGRIPFSGDTAVSIAIKHLQNEVPSPKKLNPSLPQSIENIILKATAKDPFHRYASVREMEEDLHTALSPERFNEEKFKVPFDHEEMTKAIPIIKDGDLGQLEETKIVKTSANQEQTSDLAKGPTTKRKKKWLKISLIAFGAIVGLIILAFAILPGLLQVDEVTIPEEIVGMEYDEANRELTALGLVVDREDIHDEEVEEGIVIRHDPESGNVVRVNSKITLFVSAGKEKFEMEDYTLRDKDLVLRTLINQGFKEENIVWQEQETNNYDENTVISQKPEKGELIHPEETTVVLTYSIIPNFRLENLQGYTREEVLDYFKKNDLNANFPGDRHSEHIPEGEVIEQTPTRGTEVKKGDVITVIFSLGPEPVPEPKPISTHINFEVEVSEEDRIAGISSLIRITYNDSTTRNKFVLYDERPITQTSTFNVPVTINPDGEAMIKVYINGVEAETIRYTYAQASQN